MFGFKDADDRLIQRDKDLSFDQLNFSTSTYIEIRKLAENYANSINSAYRDFTHERFERYVARYLSLLEIDEPLDEELSKKLCDSRWWEKRIHQRRKRAIGAVSREVGLVNRDRCYVDDCSIRRFIRQEAQMRDFRENTYVVNEQGHRVQLSEFYETSVSNPRIRRIELLTRINGMDTWAQSRGDLGVFVTLTTPSKMHRYSGSRFNPKFDGTDPRSAQDYLCSVWARCRSFLGRQGIEIYGLRVAEPHEDGTPHWHMCLYTRPNHMPILKRTLRQYGLEVDGDEPGAQKHRVQFKDPDNEKGCIASYLAKYIAKNVDGYNLDHDDHGNPIEESVTRTTAWARTFNIRQFQFVGEPPVTIWRELRKLEKPFLYQPLLEQLRCASREGNYHLYIELMGGMGSSVQRPVVRLPNNIDQCTGELLTGSEVVPLPHLLCNGVLTPIRTQQWQIETPSARTRAHIEPGRRLWLDCAEATAEDLGLLSITVRKYQTFHTNNQTKEKPPP